MPFVAGSGPDATVRIDVEADAAEAAAKIERQFAQAMAAAFKSPIGQAAVNQTVANAIKAFNKIDAQQAKTWKNVYQSGTKAAQQVGTAWGKEFKRVEQESNRAFDFNKARGARGEITALNATVAGLVQSLDKTGLSAKQNFGLIQTLAKGAATQARLATQESRTAQQGVDQATRLSIVATQQKIAADRDASNQAIASARNRARYIIEAERTIVKAISATWRAAGQVVSAFARGAASTLRGFGNAVQSSLRGVVNIFRSTFTAAGRVVSQFVSAFERAFSTIGRGVASALSKVSSAIRSALGRDEKAVDASLSRRERAMQSSQSRQQSIFSRGAAALGLLGGGAAVGSLLTSGFERAGQVELLNLTFNALLGNADKAKAVLTDLSNYARTTPFDFTEIAQSVAQLTAALGDVDKATNLTKFLGDIVALTGGTTESLGRVRLALSQIAGAGRLDSANLRQITESLPGVPIAQILADKFFGGDVQAYSQARDAGELGAKISAEAFFTAFMEGANERFPELKGFAEVAGTTLTGLTQNLKENFAIFGATLITLVQGPIKAAIGGINTVLQLMGDFVSGKLFDTTGATTPWGSQLFKPLSDNLEKLELLREILGKVALALGGLLAFKGVFGLLGLGVRAALSPLGLLVLAVTGVVSAWSLFMRASERFAATWKVVTYQFRPAIDAVLRLGRAFRTAFSGNGGGDGKPSILTRIGDAMRYVNVALGRLLAGFRIFANYLSAGLEFRGFTDFLDTLDQATAAGLSVLFHGTEWKAALDKARTEGGSVVLNLLEDTFLGPIVSFFRGPFLNVAKTVIGFISNVVGQIASAIGDIWNIIFPNKGQQDATDQLSRQIFGTTDDRSTGTKILDRLEETFLGPVIRFFRGPFASAIRSVGDFVGNLFSNYIIPGFSAVIGFFTHDFIPGIVNVAQSIGHFLSPAIQTIGNLAGQIGTLLAPIGGAIEGFISTWKDKGIGAAFSSLWDGITESAGNLWAGKDGNGGIKAGLESVWTSIKNWFSATFTGTNLSKATLTAIDLLRATGEKIGRVFSSPEFLGAVTISAAAVAGAVAVIIGAFTTGFVIGVKAELGRWGNIISDGLSNAWDSLSGGKLKFLPGPIVSAISAVLGSPAIGVGIGAGALALGGLIIGKVVSAISTAATTSAAGNKTSASITNVGRNLAGSLFTSVVNGFKGVGKGALSLAQMILPKFPASDGTIERTAGSGIGSRIVGGMSSFFRTITSPLGALTTKLRDVKKTATANFGGVGTAIATAVVGGIAAFEFGNYAGKKGDAGGMLLALLGGGATGAAIGAGFGLPLLGAAIGTAIAGIGIYFGQAAKKAQDLRDNINEIRDALVGLSGSDINTALFDTLTHRLLADPVAFDKWGQSLVDSGFDFRNFTDQIVAGTAEADRSFTDYLGRLGGQLEAAGGDVDFFNESMRKIAAAATSGTFTNLDDLLYSALGTNDAVTKFRQSLEVLGIEGHDLNNIFDYMQGSVEGGTSAFKLLNSETQITADTIGTVAGAVDAINTALEGNGTAQTIADILSNGDLSAVNALDALSQVADEVANRLNDAKDAFREALDTFTAGQYDSAPKTLQGITSKIVADLPNIASGFQQIFDDFNAGTISENVKVARLDLQTDDFKGQLNDALQGAVNAGIIFDDASMDAFLQGLLGQVDAANLDPAAEAILTGIIQGYIDGDFSQFLTPITDAMTDQTAIAQAARLMVERFSGAVRAASGNVVGAFGDAASSIFVSSPTPTVPQLDISGIINPADTTAVGEAAGQAVGDAMPPGFKKSNVIIGLKNELNATTQGLHATATAGGFRTGLAFATSMGSGFTAGRSSVADSAGNVVRAAAIATGIAAVLMFQAGVNAGRAFSLGLLAQVAAAAIAARAIAEAASNSAKRALKIASPSKVFVDIGTQVGKGFIQGIKDSEGDMAQGISDALENAVKLGVKRAGIAVQRANAAGQIFDLLQPSILPGGTTDVSRTQSTLDLRSSLGDFSANVRSAATDLLGNTSASAFYQARVEMGNLAVDLKTARESLVDQSNAAAEANRALYVYNSTLASLNASLKAGKIKQDVYNEKLSALGDKPSALTLAQISLRQTGTNSLALGTTAGNANRQAISDALDKIRSFGQAALDAGQSLPTVIAQMQAYRNQVLAQTKALGLNQAQVQSIIASYGLSDTALKQLQVTLTSLSTSTPTGIANLQDILGKLTDIREFGTEMLNAGVATSTVVAQLKTFRNAFRAQAVGFGFNAKEIDKLIDQMGLSDSALANFVKQMKDFEKAASGAAAASSAAAKAAADKAAADKAAEAGTTTTNDTSALPVQRPIGELHIHTPTGDPEAVALTVSNRLAYESLSSWS